MKTRETGLRIKMTGTINAYAHAPEVKRAVARLAARHGGCTVRAGEGAWRQGDVTLYEVATIIEVSFPAEVEMNPDDAANVEYCRRVFVAAQKAAGGEWCHIERSTFMAEHTRIDD